MRSSHYSCGRLPLRLLLPGLVLLMGVGSLAGTSAAQDASAKVTKANYPLAARFTANSMRSMVPDVTVYPNWIDKGARFWYALREGTDKETF